MAGVRPPDRYASIALALRLVALIRRRPYTRAELAETLGVHERTVRRLIDAVRAGDVTIEQSTPPNSAALVYRAR